MINIGKDITALQGRAVLKNIHAGMGCLEAGYLS